MKNIVGGAFITILLLSILSKRAYVTATAPEPVGDDVITITGVMNMSSDLRDVMEYDDEIKYEYKLELARKAGA